MANGIIKMNDKPSEKDMERFRLAIENPDFGDSIKNNGFTYYNKSVDLEIEEHGKPPAE